MFLPPPSVLSMAKRPSEPTDRHEKIKI